MAILKSVNVTGARPSIISDGSEAVAVRGEYDLSAALAVNDIVELVKLPDDHVIVDCIIDSDDVDTGAGIVMSAGLVSDGGAGNELIGNNTLGQAGGVARLDQRGGLRIAPVAGERTYGIKIQTGPAGGVAVGKVGMTLIYRSARYGA